MGIEDIFASCMGGRKPERNEYDQFDKEEPVKPQTEKPQMPLWKRILPKPKEEKVQTPAELLDKGMEAYDKDGNGVIDDEELKQMQAHFRKRGLSVATEPEPRCWPYVLLTFILLGAAAGVFYWLQRPEAPPPAPPTFHWEILEHSDLEQEKMDSALSDLGMLQYTEEQEKSDVCRVQCSLSPSCHGFVVNHDFRICRFYGGDQPGANPQALKAARTYFPDRTLYIIFGHHSEPPSPPPAPPARGRVLFG